MIATFAYGSNMNLRDLKRWFERNQFSPAEILGASPATLPNFRLAWNYFSASRGCGAANIAIEEGAQLPGILLHVTPAGLAALDRKEGHPVFYSRARNQIDAILPDGSSTKAWVYIATPEKTRPTTQLPNREYLDLLLEGALEFQLPEAHIEFLRSTPTVD